MHLMLQPLSKKEKAGMIAGFKAIIKSKEMRNQIIATCLFMCGMMAFTGFYESVMTMGGMTTEAVTNALFFYPISWALLLFISGFISDKMGRKFAVIRFGIIALVCQVGFIIGSGKRHESCGSRPPSGWCNRKLLDIQ